MIVVDTNVVACLLLEGARTNHARAAFRKDPRWAAPALWRSEFCNVLALYLRRRRLAPEHALELVRLAETIFRESEYRVDPERVMRLVARSRCSAYDCEFVALAEELGVPLVTSDGRITAEFPDTALSLEAFATDPG